MKELPILVILTALLKTKLLKREIKNGKGFDETISLVSFSLVLVVCVFVYDLRVSRL